MEIIERTHENFMYNNVLQRDMRTLDLEVKKVGNSVGLLLPANIVQEEHLKVGQMVRIMFIDPTPVPKKLFGAWKGKIDIDKAKEEMKSGWR